jgi:hypothetical protein
VSKEGRSPASTSSISGISPSSRNPIIIEYWRVRYGTSVNTRQQWVIISSIQWLMNSAQVFICL